MFGTRIPGLGLHALAADAPTVAILNMHHAQRHLTSARLQANGMAWVAHASLGNIALVNQQTKLLFVVLVAAGLCPCRAVPSPPVQHSASQEALLRTQVTIS